MAGFDNDTMYANNVDFTGNTNPAPTVLSDGQLLIGSTATPNIRVGIPTMNANGNIAVGAGTLTLNPYNTAKWIVDPTANLGTHQTITAATAAASSGETIFIRPGTYTENFTAKPGVNYAAFLGDSRTPSVTIVGTVTMSGAGISTFGGIRFQTNAAAMLEITGSAASFVECTNCYFNATNASCFTLSSSGGSRLTLTNCLLEQNSAGSNIFTCTNGCAFQAFYTSLFAGVAVSASTLNASIAQMRYSLFVGPITATAGSVTATDCRFESGGGISAAVLTTATSGTSEFRNCILVSDSASTLSAGAGTTIEIYDSAVSSSNANAFTGAGTINYGGITFYGSSSTVNTTTTTRKPLTTLQGGTGLTSYVAGDTLFASATNVLSALAKGSDGQVLTLASGFPSWGSGSASITGASGTILQGQGIGTPSAFTTATYPATTTINQILYSSAANVVSGITVANTGLLRTNASGVPSIGNTLSGDFTFTTGTAGTTRIVTVNNTNNSNTSSNANLTIAQGGTSGGYAGLTWEKGTTRSYAFGIPNSTSETLVLQTTNAAGVTPGSGTNVWSMTNAGQRNMPLQPCFSATLASSLSNVTGDSTNYTVLFDTAGTNVGSVYSTGTGLFTAPVAGTYQINFSTYATTTSTFSNCDTFVYINSTPTFHYTGNFNAATTSASCRASQFVTLAASDTVSIHVLGITAAATKNTTILGASNGSFNNFSVFLFS